MSLTLCSKLFARFFVGFLLAGAAFCQTISIVSGDGQALSLSDALSVQSLVVLVRDASGNPIPNATVSWAVVTPQGGGFASDSTKTDSNGNASNSFLPPGTLPLNASFF